MPWTAKATDDFNRAAENPLGNGVWSNVTGESAMAIVSTNQYVTATTDANDCASRYSGRTWADDQYSKAKVVSANVGSGQGAGVMVRCASGARTYYRVIITSAAPPNNLVLDKQVSGAHSVLANYSTTYSASTYIELYVEGQGTSTTLTVIYNGVTFGPFVDSGGSAINSGYAGLAYSSTAAGARWDDWEGGEMVTAATDRRPMRLMSAWGF